MCRKYTCHHAPTRRAYDFTMPVDVFPEQSTGLAVEVVDLVKRYPKSPVNAVDGVTFAAAAGRGVRPARAERRGEDDDRRHADDPRPADGGLAAVAGVDVVARPGAGARAARRRARSAATSTARSRSATT